MMKFIAYSTVESMPKFMNIIVGERLSVQRGLTIMSYGTINGKVMKICCDGLGLNLGSSGYEKEALPLS